MSVQLTYCTRRLLLILQAMKIILLNTHSLKKKKITIIKQRERAGGSPPLADLRHEARVVRSFGAQVFGSGDVEERVHQVGGHVQGQSHPAAPVTPRTVAVHLAPEQGVAQKLVAGSG